MDHGRAGNRQRASRLVLGLLLACILLAPESAWAVGSTTYQVDAQHDGSLPDSTPAPPLTRRWERDLGDQVSYPVIADGRMFVSSSRAGEESGLITALDLATGRTLWSRAAGVAPSLATYDDGRLFVVDERGYVRALDPATGATEWIDKEAQYIYTKAPVAIDGLLYVVGDGSGSVIYVYRESDGELLSSRGYVDNANTPTIDDQRIYAAGACYGDAAYDRITLALAWADGPADDCYFPGSPPAVLSRGRLYVPGRAAAAPRGVVRDTSTGAILSTFDADVTPAFSGTTGLFLLDGTLRAQDTDTGLQEWSFSGDGTLASPPIVVGSHVYVVSGDGTLYALSLLTGEVEWSGDIGDRVPAPDTGSEVGLGAGEGVLAVPAGGKIVAYSSTDIPSTPDPPPATGDPPGPAAPSADAVTYQNNPAHDGYADGDYAAGQLRERWSRELDARVSYPIIASGRVFVVEQDESLAGWRLSAFDLADGRTLWSTPVPAGPAGPYSDLAHFAGPAYADGRLFVAFADGLVRAYDPATGNELWTTQIFDGFDGAPTAVGDLVYVKGTDEALYALDASDGSVRWQSPAYPGNYDSPTVAAGQVFVDGDCGGPEAFDAATGAIEWQHAPTCEGGSGLDTSLHGGHLYGAGLVYGAADGQLEDIDTAIVAGATTLPAFNAQYMVYPYHSRLIAEDVRTNRILWSFTGDGENFISPIIVGQRVVAGTSDGRLYTVDLASGEQEWTGVAGAAIADRTCCDSLSGLAAADGAIVVPAAGRLVVLDGNATGPITRITGGAGFSSDTTPTLDFAAPDATGYECRLDDGAFVPCDSPFTTPALDDGEHSVAVRATSAADGGPTTTAWVTIDTVAPDTTITEGPPPRDNDRFPGDRFAFESSEGGVTLTRFECSRDGAAFTACQPPDAFSISDALDDGEHTLRVRAIDRAGNVDPTPAAWTWTLDTHPPTLTVTGGPPAATTQTSATFHLSLDEPGTTHCQLERADAVVSDAACPGPDVVFTSLVDGDYQLHITGTDLAGNRSDTVDRSWRVDHVPPEITVDAPTGTVKDTSATIRFYGNEAIANFECKLDAGTFASCPDPAVYDNLSTGQHTFTVRLTDLAGNAAQSEPVSWTIDDVPPQVDLHGPGARVGDSFVEFSFTADEPAQFRCSLDVASPLGYCASPVVLAADGEGPHTFYLTATDTVGNSTEVSYQFTLDTTGPTVTLTRQPPPTAYTSDASFGYASSEPNSTFECRLDAGDWEPCPATGQDYTSLDDGAHDFSVRATDDVGNVGDSTGIRWQTFGHPPDTTITAHPPAVTNAKVATFALASTISPATFECSIDGGPFVECPQQPTFTFFRQGAHHLEARATGPAGTDQTPATFDWILDLFPPDTTITHGPGPLAIDGDARLAFIASEPATFVCRLDGGAWAPCRSPVQLHGLATGFHVFEVSATDQAGNTAVSPTAWSWIIAPGAKTPTIDRAAVRAVIDRALRRERSRLRKAGLAKIADARRVRIDFRIPATGRLTLRLEIVDGTARSIGHVSVTATDGLTTRATIRLGAKTRSELRRAGSLELRLAASFAPASGKRIALSRSGRVKRG